MKKLISICMLLFAISIALGHSIVPHHEHGYKIHMSLACTSDCSGHEKNGPTECISQMDEAILISKEDNKCACGEHHEHYPAPLFTFLVSFFIERPHPNLEIFRYEGSETFYSNLYTSTYIPKSKGLRAPPVSDFLS